MDRGSYIAASGGLVQFRKLEVTNNNLANVNTAGFKRQLLVGETQSFDQTFAKALESSDPYARPDHERTPGTVNVQTVTDFSPGSIRDTSNPLDVALRNPKDFFVVQGPNGTEYTRAGNFTLNSEGQLVTQDGFSVQGDGGAITADGTNVRINADGGVVAGKEIVGRLQVVRFDQPEQLERAGSTRFAVKAGGSQPTPVDGDMVPQALEMANVSAISSMIELISANRAFELYTKSAQSIDQLNQTAISQVGRPRG